MPGGGGRHASAKIHLLHSVDSKSINAVAASLDKPGDHAVANAAEEHVLGPVVGLTQQYHRFGPPHLWFSRFFIHSMNISALLLIPLSLKISFKMRVFGNTSAVGYAL